MNKIKYLFPLLCFIAFSCSKSPKKDINNPPVNTDTRGKGSFTFKGKTYIGNCAVIPQSTDTAANNYPGFQWSMSIDDDTADAFLTIGMFPQNDQGEFRISNNESNGYNDRNGILSLSSSEVYKIRYGRITKLSKTKFSMEGVAFADLSNIPIPFTAEGDIMDLTPNFNIKDKSPYPKGTGLVSFFTSRPLNGDTLSIIVWQDETKAKFISYGGAITYQSGSSLWCDGSECFFFASPGKYYFEALNQKGLPFFSSHFTCEAGTCNLILFP
ncbi:MAG: hypothetical protein WC716_04430 [Chitinophagaceae bacterium]|jgi:hypothetical protein